MIYSSGLWISKTKFRIGSCDSVRLGFDIHSLIWSVMNYCSLYLRTTCLKTFYPPVKTVRHLPVLQSIFQRQLQSSYASVWLLYWQVPHDRRAMNWHWIRGWFLCHRNHQRPNSFHKLFVISQQHHALLVRRKTRLKVTTKKKFLKISLFLL